MSSFPIVVATFEEIQKIPTDGAKCFIWMDEVESFDLETQKVVFTEQSKEYDTEPLIIDAFTASAIIKVLDAVKPETRTKLIERLERNRAYFAHTVEQVWKCVK
ncbi:hypothetical protein [Vibrio phage vB_VpS_PG28]|nr:hypothetical protein [Vibrio phage vB_VpS_PG28]